MCIRDRPNIQGFDFELAPEHAWNYGVSFLKGFQIGSVPLNVNADLYRTEFVNQVVVDWETIGQISFYNLSGESYANSFQLGLDTRLFRILDARFAYKYYDVKVDYSSGRMQKPLHGKKTKQIQELMGADKTYIGTICLGATTTSYDLETRISYH